MRADSASPFQSNNLDTPLVINIGVWSSMMDSYDEFLKANRLIEQTVSKFGGKKWFYAHSYYTEKEFWTRYDRKRYDTLRTKYHATTLPTIYDKVTVKVKHEVHYKRGALLTMLGLAKLRIKD